MKKQLKMAVIVIIVGIVVSLFIIGLLGNSYNTNDIDKLIGTWKNEEAFPKTYTFFSNGGCSISGIETTYEIKNGKIIFTFTTDPPMTKTFDYSFSNNETMLTLTDVSTEKSVVYTKQ